MTKADDLYARRVFCGAAVWGVLVVTPLYFAESILAHLGRPPVTHPEFLYGFVGGTLVAQLFYWRIGGDPRRYRDLMPLAALAKFAWCTPIVLLYIAGRADVPTLSFAAGDAVLGVLFVAAWRRTNRSAEASLETW